VQFQRRRAEATAADREREAGRRREEMEGESVREKG